MKIWEEENWGSFKKYFVACTLILVKQKDILIFCRAVIWLLNCHWFWGDMLEWWEISKSGLPMAKAGIRWVTLKCIVIKESTVKENKMVYELVVYYKTCLNNKRKEQKPNA